MGFRAGNLILRICFITILLINTWPIFSHDGSSNLVSSQPFEETYRLEWNQTLSPSRWLNTYSTLERTDHSIVFLGTSPKNATELNNQLYLWCVTTDGDLQWTRHYSYYIEYPDKPILVNRNNEEFMILFSNNGSGYCWGFDKDGHRVWNTTYTATGYLMVQGASRLQDETILAVGALSQTENLWSTSDIWIASFNDVGTLLWNCTIPTNGRAVLGSTIFEYQTDQILVVGDWALWYPHGMPDTLGWFVMAIDKSGTVVWVQYYEEEAKWNFARVQCWDAVACEDDGFFILVEESEAWSYDYTWLYRLDATGHLLWRLNLVLQIEPLHLMQNCMFMSQKSSLCIITMGVEWVTDEDTGQWRPDEEISGLGLDESGNVAMNIQIPSPGVEMDLRGVWAGPNASIYGFGEGINGSIYLMRLEPALRPTPPILYHLNLYYPFTIILSWSPSVDLDGYIEGYQLQVAQDVNQPLASVFSTLLAEYYVSDLHWMNISQFPRAAYFRVRSVDNLNICSAWSNIVWVARPRVSDWQQWLQEVLNRIRWVGIEIIVVVIFITAVLFLRREIRKSRSRIPTIP